MRQHAARSPLSPWLLTRRPSFGLPLAAALVAMIVALAPRPARADDDDDTTDDDATVVRPDMDITPGQGEAATPGREARPTSDIFFSIQAGGGVAHSGPTDSSQSQDSFTTPGFMGRLVFRSLVPLGKLYSRPPSCTDEGSNGCSEGGFVLDFHTVLETTMTNSFLNPYYWEWEQTILGGRHRWSDLQSGGFGAEIEYAMIGAYFRDGTDLQFHIKTGQLTLFQGSIADGFAISDSFAIELGLHGGVSMGGGQYQYYGMPNAYLGLHEWIGGELAARFPGILRISLTTFFRRIDATNFGPADTGLMFVRTQLSFQRPGDLPISFDGRMDENWRVTQATPGLVTWSGLVTYYYP